MAKGLLVHDDFCPLGIDRTPPPRYCAGCRRIEKIRADERAKIDAKYRPVIISVKWYYLAEWVGRALRAEKALEQRGYGD